MEGKANMIQVPTLIINGIDEFASGDAVKAFIDEIPDVRLITMEGTTHSPNYEKKEEYMEIVGSFLAAPWSLISQYGSLAFLKIIIAATVCQKALGKAMAVPSIVDDQFYNDASFVESPENLNIF